MGVRTLCIAQDNETGRATTLHVQDGNRLKSVVPLAVNVVSNARPLLFASLLAVASLALPAIARADCSVAPLGSTDDLVVSFLEAQGGTQAAASTQFASPVKEGMLVYDDTTNALRYCDGTNWVSLVGSGGGGSATAAGAGSEVQFRNSSTGAFNADANFVWDDTNDRLGIGTTSPNQILSVAGATGGELARFDAGASGNSHISVTAGTGRLVLAALRDSGGAVGSFDNSKFSLRTNNTDRVWIDTSGNVGIATATPAASALLDLTSTTKGFLPPRMTQAQRDAIASPATGLVVYNIDTNALNFYNGTTWTLVGSGSGSGTSPAFVAYRASDFTVTANTFTEVAWSSTLYNINNNYNTTNGRFTPTVAGRYIITAQAYLQSCTAGSNIAIYKNGGTVLAYGGMTNANWRTPTVAAIADMNGTTDYVSAWIYCTGGSSIGGTMAQSHFAGALLGGSGGGGGGSSTLAGLTDVDTSAAANGKSLVYNSTTSKWEAQAITGASTTGFFATYSGVTIGTSMGDITGYTEQRDDGGNNFNPSTGVFTAPVAGYYVLTGQVNFTSGNSGFASVVLNVGGSNHCYSFETTNAGNYFRGCAAVVYMTAGQTAKLRAETQSGTTTASGMFTASLIGGSGGGGSSQWTTAGSDIHYGTGGVAIGQAAAPEATAALEIESTTKGLLLPRMTTAQVTTLSSNTPPDGMLVYDTDTDTLKLRANGAFVSLGSTASSIYVSAVHNGTAQTITSTASKLIQWAEQSDSNNAFASGTFTAPSAGNYAVYGGIGSENHAINEYIEVQIRKNGSIVEGALDLSTASWNDPYTNATWFGYLNAGDTIELWGRTYSASTTTYALKLQVMSMGNGPSGGGSAIAAGSTGQIQFNGGSGAFAADSGLVWDNTNKRLGIGTTTPGEKLTVSSNTGVLPAAPNVTAARFAGADSQAARIVVDTFGGAPNLTLRRANGTAASPTAVTANDTLGNVVAFGYGATGYSSSSRAALQMIAAENWTDTAQGTSLTLMTTPNGSVTPAERLRIDQSGNVGIGTTSPASKLHIAGGVQLGDDAASCPGLSDAKVGTLKFASDVLWVCKTTGWAAADGGGSPSGSGTGEIQINNGGTLSSVTNFYASTVNTTTVSCPAGYTAAGDGCYRLITTTMNQATALTNCQSDGGTLAKIDNATENSVVQTFMGADSWIGANDITTEGTWQWADGSSLAYSNWNSGEPNNSGGNQDCGYIYFSGGKWDDDTCTVSKRAVCEAAPTTGAGPDVTYINLPNMSIAESNLTGSEPCGTELDGVLIRRSGALFLCDFAYSGGWVKIQMGNRIAMRYGAGYFVMTSNAYAGGFGGLSGANDLCLNELRAYSWEGKTDAELRGLIVPSKVKAFLCNGTTCQDPQPSTTYYFAVAGTAYGGGTFVTDASGLGPNDNNNWTNTTRLCTTPDGYGGCASGSNYWTGRNTGTTNVWPAAAHANHCTDWTSSASGVSGRAGTTGTGTGRWSSGSPTCNNTRRLICIVNP